ncbi:MAG TPA: phosphatase PAP2 family protein [Nanoarchaeota archaeon]|nr:phosphatase PAP2 family protein [Nanoarchaeota archaeon]
MRSTNNKLLVSVCTSLLLIFLLFFFPLIDSGIVGGISNLRSDGLDQVMGWITNIGSGIVIFFIITALFLYEERKRKWIIPLWLSFALASLITLALKLLVARERPFELLGLVSTNEFAFWDSSFPSWHAVMAFSALPVLDREFSRIKIFWIAFALLIIFSRLYFGVHFLSDVVAGALLGYLSGFLFVRTWENHVWKGNKKMGVRAHGRK